MARERLFDEAKELVLLKIINWAQKNGKEVGKLTPEDIRAAIKSKH